MNFTSDSWIALLPILVTSVTVVATMLAIAIRRNHKWNATICVAGLNLALLSCLLALNVAPQQVTGLLVIDKFALFYDVIVLGAALATATLSFNYMEGYAGEKEELYVLLALTALGGLVLVSATNFVTFFIGMEITAVSMYGMIGYPHRDRRALEASIKYMILSAIAGAFILFGMALIYAQTGTLSFNQLADGLVSGTFAASGLLVTGGALIIVGVGFEVSLVPFHLWAPDVYEGAPAPIGGYLATASKAAMFAVLLRYFVESRAYESALLLDILSVMAVLSIVVGNVLALLQQNLKRMLAYSAIAHFGYALVAFVATGAFAVEAVGFYLASYVVTTLGAFGVIAIISTPIKASDADTLYDYRGQFWRRPYLAAILTAMLMSLAGAPMTALFIGKLYVFAASIDQRLWILVGAVTFGSAAGLFYYSRAAIVMFQRRRWVEPFKAPRNWTFQAGGMAVITLTFLMLLMGLYPQPVMELIKAAGLHAPQAGNLALNVLAH
ncbi:MAG: NADH-quinone oxidoreductase subunit NuoN [Nevskiaceae bacterium]|nr:MAG: NADH-quinone oxidoreductase subunit NuoN [Nevskiaceae bacterium]TBR73934.1 MAG: NADH-quinone oxidoreductase subunit NuoN [Nevskiaceae bacterium]